MIPGLLAIPPIKDVVYVPQSPYTMWQNTNFDMYTYYSNYSIRQLIKPLAGYGKMFRVTVRAWVDNPGINETVNYAGSVDHMSLQVQGSGYNTKFAPVEVLFGGQHGFAKRDANLTSDWVELPNVVTDIDNLIVIADMSGNGAVTYVYSGSGLTMWYKSNTDSYDQAAPAGTWQSHTNFLGLITQIEAK